MTVSMSTSAHDNHDVAFVMLHKSALPSDRQKLKELPEYEVRRTQMKGLALLKDCTTELAIRDEVKGNELRKYKEENLCLNKEVSTIKDKKKLLKASIDAQLVDQLKNRILDLERDLVLEKEGAKTEREHYEDRENWFKNQIKSLDEKLNASKDTVALKDKELADMHEKIQEFEGSVAELKSSRQKFIDELTEDSNRIVNEKVKEQFDAFMALHGIDMSSI